MHGSCSFCDLLLLVVAAPPPPKPPHSLYMGLSIPYYFETVLAKTGKGPIQTDSTVINNILNR